LKERGFRIAAGHRTARKRKPIKPRTRAYYEERITALLKSWPSLATTQVRRVTQRDCESWADKFSTAASASAYNHTISILRQIMQIGVERGARHDNPAPALGRISDKPKQL